MIHAALKRAGHNVHALLSPLPTSAEASSMPPPAMSPVTTLPRNAPKRRVPWPEMVALYYNIDALRTSDSPVVLQFVSARPREGTSTVARAFASFAAGEETSSVLLIDGSCHGALPRPAFGHGPVPSLAEIARAGERIEAAIEPGRTPDLHEARLADHANSLLHTNGTAWAGVLEKARQRYRFTVIDSPAVSTNPDTVVLARACDGVVLV